MRRSRASRLAALALCLFGLASAAAQEYPVKPIRVVVGFAAGGPTDVIARIIAQDMSVMFGQSVIVDNRTGANSLIATELVAAAAPDGYTLMLCNIATHAITPARAKKLPYDHVRDFAFVSMVGTTPNVIVTHPAMAMKNLKDVIAYAKKIRAS